MPPRYAYWTIIAGGLPTAFRAAHQDELMPTFRRIKEKHPDAEMKWFARGKLWESQDAARAADKRGGLRAPRRVGGGRTGEQRTRDWRPGGDHRDPRQKFIDAKKQRNAALRKERWTRKTASSQRQSDDERSNDVNVPPTESRQNRKPSQRPFHARGAFRKSSRDSRGTSRKGPRR